MDCSVACRWDVGNESRRQQEDWYLRDVPYQGEPSEEDYYFYRVPTHLLETIKQRRRKTNAIRKEPLDNPDDREVVKFEVGKDTEMNDGEEVDSDIVVDESKPEEHISGANVGGRFTRRRK